MKGGMTVYSKDRGITHRELPRFTGDPAPSYRQSTPERVQVPPNYSGHAIVDGEERPLGSLPVPEPPPSLPVPEAPTPRFDGLPQVSVLGDRRQPRGIPAAPVYAEVTATPEETEPPESGTAPHRSPQNTTAAHGTPKNAASPHETPLPAISLPRHSLGTLSWGLEELLLLGLILFLLMENSDCPDRGDLDETVILLGLLLLLR
jgi:hypothetical protein